MNRVVTDNGVTVDLAYIISAISYERLLISWRNATDEQLLDRLGKFPRNGNGDKFRADARDPYGIVMPLLYRPFDIRTVYYTGSDGIMACPRRAITEIFLGPDRRGYYHPNRTRPLDPYSEPLDLEGYDTYMLDLLGNPAPMAAKEADEPSMDYLLCHPYINLLLNEVLLPNIPEVQCLSLKEAVIWIFSHAKNVDVEIRVPYQGPLPMFEKTINERNRKRTTKQASLF